MYVDDFAFFSPSDAVEQKFRELMNSEYTVSYNDHLEWFLGMKFDWYQSPDALCCHVYPEAFILDIVDCHNLSDCNKSTRATPFRSGLFGWMLYINKNMIYKLPLSPIDNLK